MRVAQLSPAELRTSARQAWIGWPEPANGEVIGPVKIEFQLLFTAFEAAVIVSRLLRAPRPELVWLMGGMETELRFPCGTEPPTWQVAGRTQTVWLTLPLLEGFLLALWQQTRLYHGVLEEWAFEGPGKG